ncbi:MAG: hypothetical protein Kow00124_27040 [Anaerolineae bacterium]
MELLTGMCAWLASFVQGPECPPPVPETPQGSGEAAGTRMVRVCWPVCGYLSLGTMGRSLHT